MAGIPPPPTSAAICCVTPAPLWTSSSGCVTRKSGGLAFVPHIYIYKENAQKILEELVNHYKIDGVECYYSLFNEQKIEEITQYAKEHNLYMSGGTDYHGKNKPNIKLGTGIYDMHIPETILNNWINKVKYLNPQNFVMN